MERKVYDPSCLPYCGDLCGPKCKGNCNDGHDKCAQGKLPADFLSCPTVTSSISILSLGFTTYESVDVETFGKGSPYKRVEKIVREYPYEEFQSLLKKEFEAYAEHTLSYWFLRATKLEAFAPSKARATAITITSDFGEAIQIVGKRETSDQFYHRPEVIGYLNFFFKLLPVLGLRVWFGC